MLKKQAILPQPLLKKQATEETTCNILHITTAETVVTMFRLLDGHSVSNSACHVARNSHGKKHILWKSLLARVRINTSTIPMTCDWSTQSATTQKKLTGVNKMTTTKITEIKQLQDFAHANYEDGGHWVYETFDCADYQEMLDNNKGNMEICKAQLRHHWEQLCMLEREYAFGDE
jgi:hypothetical protein